VRPANVRETRHAVTRPHEVREGMPVQSSDGKRLGSVLMCRRNEFIVEKHAFSMTDYVVPYEDVADISGDEIVLSRSREELARFDRKDERPGPVPETYGDEGGGGHG